MGDQCYMHEVIQVPDPSLTLLRTHQAYRWYWFGQSVSIIGSEVASFALPLVTALTLDAGPAGVSAVATASMLPYLLFSLLAGHWLQGKDNRKVMMIANFVQAIFLLTIPVAWVLGVLTIPILMAVAFVAGSASLVFGLAAFAYVPSLVSEEELPAANRAAQGTRTLAQVGGPGWAGIIVQLLGAPLAILIDALSYIVSAIGIAKGHPLKPYELTRSDKTPHILSGLRILVENPFLRALTVHAALYNFSSEILSINLVLWAVKEQDVSSGAFGLALSAAGIGSLIGTLVALRWADSVGLGNAFASSLVFSCWIPILIPIWPQTGVALALLIGINMLVSGIGLGNANVYSLTLRQTVIPEEQLSRSAGAYAQIMYGLIPIGSVAAGVLGESLGSRTAILLGAIGLALSAIPMFLPRIRSLQSTSAARESI